VDRRKSLRFRLQLPLVARWTDGEGKVRYGAGFSRDICARGVFIVSSERPPIGAMVLINVQLPYVRADSKEWQLQSVGSVVRVEQAADSAGYAVQCDFRGLEDIAQ
jgi:hypothetical protein